VHLALLVTGLAIEIYILKASLSAVQQYQIVYRDMEANPDVEPEYAVYENFISVMFNRFFFGASSECSSKYVLSVYYLKLILPFRQERCITGSGAGLTTIVRPR